MSKHNKAVALKIGSFDRIERTPCILAIEWVERRAVLSLRK